MRSAYNDNGDPRLSWLQNPSLRPPSPLGSEGDSLAALRRAVAKLETVAPATGAQHLPLGVRRCKPICRAPALSAACCMRWRPRSRRPAGGLRLPVRPDGGSAALASGPAVFVASRRALLDFGTPYGHGLAQLGLDVGRLLLVETRDRQGRAVGDRGGAAIARRGRPWSPARSRGGLDLTSSRRLNLAAAAHATPLLLLRTAERRRHERRRHALAHRRRAGRARSLRRLRAARAGRVALERCRNGRPGEWLIEWDSCRASFPSG